MKSIIGIAVVAVLFLGFAYINSKQQKEYLEKKEAYDAYMDSVARATRPAVPAADSTASGEVQPEMTAEEAAAAARERQVRRWASRWRMPARRNPRSSRWRTT